MKKTIILFAILFTLSASAAVRVFYWQAPGGSMMKTYTSNPRHIALMDTWLERKCKREKPVRKAYTQEEWKALTPAEKKAKVKLKFKWYKFTDPNTGVVTGDDMWYTQVGRSPILYLNSDPNKVTYDFDPNEVE